MVHSSRLFALFAAAALILGASASPSARAGQITIRHPDEVEFAATIYAGHFDSGSMAGYHAIVWKDGRAARSALLEADVSDRQVIRALEGLGARPANNLSMDVWENRKDPKKRDADATIAGPAVEVLLRLPGHADLLPLESVLEDPAGRGLDLRYGGNEENIPKWKSGCIVCLYSCPGSKVGNARYTVRDYVGGTTRFRAKPGVLPPDGTRLGVVLRLEK